MTILDKILDFAGGEKFYRFGNADGKYWIVPVQGMRTALNLYQPSGTKGKMVKALLPCLHMLAPVRKAIKAQTMNCRLNSELQQLLCKLFEVKKVDFAVFEGTPSASQKMTIQVSDKSRILGYCKISNEKNILELFEKEYNNLNWLNGIGIKGIPQALYCGEINGVFLFIQSTRKNNSSKIPHRLMEQHIEFIDKMTKATSIEIPFEKSDFYNDIVYLESIIDNIRKEEMPVFEQSIRYIKECYKGEVCSTFSFLHGDFTPWNMYLEKGELQVFDFEFAARTFPPRMDLIHFALQTWILEDKLCAEKIHPKLEIFKKQYGLSDTLTICYLTHILSFYFKLYNGIFDPNDNGYITWCSLLKKQLDNRI